MSVGLTNYASAYATGLLLARRLLTKLKLDTKYQGTTDIKGEDYNVEELEDGPHPFHALLDVGLRITTTGSRVFAALKGACDGGLQIPHSETRFVGYDEEGKKLNAEILRKHIFGGHVADYMKHLKEDEPAKFDKQFGKYIKAGIKADDLEKTWTKVHAAIRKNPVAVLTVKKKTDRTSKKRMSLAQRKDRVRQKIAAHARKEQ